MTRPSGEDMVGGSPTRRPAARVTHAGLLTDHDPASASSDKVRGAESFHRAQPHGEDRMQLGMIGLGRMGANMTRRLLAGGHEVCVYDVDPSAGLRLENEGAKAAKSPQALIDQLARPRALWLMVPVAFVDDTIARFAPLLDAGDVLIDGGNSRYHDDLRRARELEARGLHYVDVGTSGGVFGLERGYCLMIGGETEIVSRL